MEILFLVGRIIFGMFLLMNASNHFMKTDMLVGYAASKGIHSPKLAVYISGLFLLLGGLGIILGVYIEWTVLAIALFFIPVTFKMHNFWADTDPSVRMGNQVNFMKNMAILGASLMFLAIPQSWPFSL